MPERAASRIGWTTVAFGDVVRLSAERSSKPESEGFERFVGLEHIEPGDLRIRRWGDIADGTTFTNVFRAGKVLFGKRRAYQRKVAVADFAGVCSGDIYVLEPKGKDLLPEFLPFICQTDAFFEHAVGTSAGSLSPRTNWTSLAGFEFALPPIEEQRRLVALFLAANAAVERIADCLQSCDDVIAASRTSLFDPKRFKPVPLRQLCDEGRGIQIGPFGAQLHQSDYEQVGVPVVMPLNMRDDRIVEDGIARVSEKKARSLSLHRMKEGDILLPRRGELDRRALVTASNEGWLCGTGSIRVRLMGSVPPLAVLNSLASPHCVRWLKANAVGSTMPNLNTTIVGNTPIVLPPKGMLGATVAVMVQLDSERERLGSRQEALRRVLQALAEEAMVSR